MLSVKAPTTSTTEKYHSLRWQYHGSGNYLRDCFVEVLMKTVRLSGKEFIAKLLSGERDFDWVNLEGSFDITRHERFLELQEYCRKQHFSKSPLQFNYAIFYQVVARGLSLPHLRAYKANFQGADFSVLTDEDVHAQMKYASSQYPYRGLQPDLTREASLAGSFFVHANLFYAKLRGTDLSNATLVGAGLYDVDMEGADFRNADLNGAIATGLQKARNADSVRNLEKVMNVTPFP